MIPPHRRKIDVSHPPARCSRELAPRVPCPGVTAEGTGGEERAVAGRAWPPIPTFAFEQDLLEEWKGKGAQVEEIGRRGTLLENLIVEITAPNTPPKAGELWPALLRTPLLSPLHLL